MSKCLKKLFAIVVSLAILIACIPTVSVFAETLGGTCGENVTWSLDTESGILTISGKGYMDHYNYSSHAPWYSQRASIKSVNIENGVTSIGNNTFYYCSSLTSVTIPDSVTSIGWYAFDGCSSLTSITIPNSVTSIGSGAFADCSSLASVNIPDGVTSIGNNTFHDCSSLTSVTIPDSVTIIGDWAFIDCSSLTSITIPDSVTSIGNNTFYDCSSLTIRCYKNSAAHNYAIENNISYTLINGDANGDGRINNKDLGLLMQKLNGWAVEIDDAVADVNADGKVNNKDYGLLMQYVNGWDVEIG